MTKQRDKNTKFRPFTQGQKVWLEGTNLKMTHPTTKLAPWRYGPFQIACVLSPVVYQLMLPPQWKQKCIHDVFHASLLTPYHETTEHGPNFPAPPPDIIEGETEYEVEHILNSRRAGRGCRLEYLVRWKGYSEADDSWEPRQNIHAPDLLRQFHATYPSAIHASYINLLDFDEDYAPSSLNSSYPPLIPLQRSPLPHMSVSNGAIQTIVQGRCDETNTPPELVTEPLNDDEALTLIATPLLIANASLSEDGGSSDGGSDSESRGGSRQDVGRGTAIDEHAHVSSTCPPPLTVSGHRSAWYTPTSSSNPTAPSSYVPFPDTSPVPTPMYDRGTNRVLYQGGAPNPATYADGYGHSQLRWYQLGHDPRHCYIIFIPTIPGGPLTPAPEFAFIPQGEEPTILGRLDANSPVYAEPLYARPATLSHIAGVDDGDLSMLHAMSPIRHLVYPLLKGLGDPGVLTDVHRLHLLDRDIHKQAKAELAHLLSLPARHADQTPSTVARDMRITRDNYVLANHLNTIEDQLMDAAVHSCIIAPLQQAIVRPFLGGTVFYLQPCPGQHKHDNIPWMLATLSQHEPIRVGHPTRTTRARPAFLAHEMLTPFSNYDADDYGDGLLLTRNRSGGQDD